MGGNMWQSVGTYGRMWGHVAGGGGMSQGLGRAYFSIFHDLWSGFKVSEMGWEVKKIVRGQSKHGLWGCNLKTGKFLPGGTQEQI